MFEILRIVDIFPYRKPEHSTEKKKKTIGGGFSGCGGLNRGGAAGAAKVKKKSVE